MYIIIVGCGRVGTQLAHLLSDAGHNVVVIDKEAETLQKLGADFNGLTLTGDGFDVDLLKEAGITILLAATVGILAVRNRRRGHRAMR